MEAVLAAEPIWNFRSVLRCPGGDERDGAFGADVRFHRGARPCLGSGRKRGQHDQALGRSRGGFSTKIHLKTDFGGLPIAFHLTGGEASDSRNFETLLDIGPDLNPRAALGDKGYDSKSNRDAARQRGICPGDFGLNAVCLGFYDPIWIVTDDPNRIKRNLACGHD